MRKKGISAVIATVLLVMITVALAGLAYLFIDSMLSQGKWETVLEGQTVCGGGGYIWNCTGPVIEGLDCGKPHLRGCMDEHNVLAECPIVCRLYRDAQTKEECEIEDVCTKSKIETYRSFDCPNWINCRNACTEYYITWSGWIIDKDNYAECKNICDNITCQYEECVEYKEKFVCGDKIYDLEGL